jgi:hypothetical protein
VAEATDSGASAQAYYKSTPNASEPAADRNEAQVADLNAPSFSETPDPAFQPKSKAKS